MILRKPRYFYIITTLLLLGIELIIALFINDGFVRPYLGDLLATIVVYGIVMSITNSSVRQGMYFALFISFAIELMQLLQIVDVLGLTNNRIARIVIGTSFSWMDLLMYTLGAAIIYILERTLNHDK
ncbi:Protein of unknown function [Nonlabens sp. Hel1_33_55]|uniref:ribosomal maturation YjgA family protein n=1 Tax=Nonlabens sp. Hel1_33_55 TaxID=1336802 RepID=UPI000875E8FA|nr:DUF2809 domain-containing protein [Nonlabens sp. Hel1_33_55]SCX88471.1 Protein of unknown function [Nonlabens sp. Hel1_33_55]